MSFGSGGSGSSGIASAGDVVLNSPTTDDVLIYDSSVQKWKNIAIATKASSANTLGTPNNPISDPAATRPSGLARVFWMCATQPSNWVNGDEWINTA